MSEELQQKLRDQLWEVANRLRGNMSASDFMYFTLGFIFYKYLSEKIEKYANSALEDDEVTFKELWDMTDADAAELQEEVKKTVSGKYRLFYRTTIPILICDRYYQAERKYTAYAGTFFETHRGQYTWTG